MMNVYTQSILLALLAWGTTQATATPSTDLSMGLPEADTLPLRELIPRRKSEGNFRQHNEAAQEPVEQRSRALSAITERNENGDLTTRSAALETDAPQTLEAVAIPAAPRLKPQEVPPKNPQPLQLNPNPDASL